MHANANEGAKMVIVKKRPTGHYYADSIHVNKLDSDNFFLLCDIAEKTVCLRIHALLCLDYESTPPFAKVNAEKNSFCNFRPGKLSCRGCRLRNSIERRD